MSEEVAEEIDYLVGDDNSGIAGEKPNANSDYLLRSGHAGKDKRDILRDRKAETAEDETNNCLDSDTQPRVTR